MSRYQPTFYWLYMNGHVAYFSGADRNLVFNLYNAPAVGVWYQGFRIY